MQEIRRIDKVKLKEAAFFYNQFLNNKDLLYICFDDQRYRYYELHCNSSNFKHLTGLRTDQKPVSLFKDCLNNHLAGKKFIYTHYTIKKIETLLDTLIMLEAPPYISSYEKNMDSLLQTDILIGDRTKCIGAIQRENSYYPNTSLITDICLHKDIKQVAAVFKKNKQESRYSHAIILDPHFRIIDVKPEILKNIDIFRLKVCNIFLDDHHNSWLMNDDFRPPQHVIDYENEMKRLRKTALALDSFSPKVEDITLLIDICQHLENVDKANGDGLTLDDCLRSIIPAIQHGKVTLDAVLYASDTLLLECIYEDNYEKLTEYDYSLTYY